EAGPETRQRQHRGRPRRYPDGAHQHGRALLARGRAGGREAGRGPGDAGGGRKDAGSAQVSLPQASSGMVKDKDRPVWPDIEEKRAGFPLAISPPSDIVLDVARAVDPAELAAARTQLAARARAGIGKAGFPEIAPTETSSKNMADMRFDGHAETGKAGKAPDAY